MQKFGGTSVANSKLIFNAAKKAIKDYKKGNNVIVVVSAQGDTTDKLIEKAKEINKNPSKRELDVLLSSGEQMSAALMAMAIEKLGYPVVSLLGWQARINSSSNYGDSIIEEINTTRIKKELDKKNIVVVAGFQGINKYEDITTLGRGGSDTSAVGIASTLNATRCKIYTDVEGVFTADPRKVENAVKLSYISYDEMLELSTSGAKVLNSRAVEIAKKHNVEIEVLSSIKDVPGTIVKEPSNMEKRVVSGITKNDDIALISVLDISDTPECMFKLFSKLYSKDIKVGTMLQNRPENGKRYLSFTVNREDYDLSLKILKEYLEKIDPEAKVIGEEEISKVSVVGAGMFRSAGILSKILETLYTEQIDVLASTSSEIKVSLLIKEKYADKAVFALHKTFF